MTGGGFNGWASWDTWNLALWLLNEERLYLRARRAWADTGGDPQATTRVVFGGGTTPDGADLNRVAWDEIGRCLAEAFEERPA